MKKLIFKRRKLFAGVGLALALVMTAAGYLQASAAGNVQLDVSQQVRLVSGPHAPNDYQDQVSASHGNVAQVSTIVHNTENAYSGPTAQNFKLKITVPKGPATSLETVAKATASNDTGSNVFQNTDKTQIDSRDGSPLTLNKPRFFQIYENNQSDPHCNDAKIDWKQPKDLPANNYQVEEQNNQFVITVDPYGNGQLKPSFCQMFKVTYLVDVTGQAQPPQLKIEKKVRKTGETNFVDANTAKVGDKMQYFVELQNVSQGTATNVVLRDALPPNVTLIPGSVQQRTSANATLVKGDDNFVNGGYKYNNFGAGAWVQVYFNVQIGNIQGCPWWFKNFALVKSDQTNGSEYYDSVLTNLVCTPTPTPTPSITPTPSVTPTPSITPTPTPTPSITPTPTPTPEICVSPTPSSTPTPGMTPTPSVSPTPEECGTPTPGVTPTPDIPQDKTGGAPPASELPKTGAAEAAMVSALALAVSGYLFIRERRNLKKALGTSRVKR
jgi:uncharacterized repeat protein (TIGR01451 family)